MQKFVWGLVLLLLILHQDVWFWESETLVFGFMPIGLFYHACISVAASVTWFLATRHCWPSELSDAKPDPMHLAGDAAATDGGAA